MMYVLVQLIVVMMLMIVETTAMSLIVVSVLNCKCWTDYATCKLYSVSEKYYDSNCIVLKVKYACTCIVLLCQLLS